MKIKVSFDEPDYNEIVYAIINNVFPGLDDEHDEDSFLPVLKEGVEIVKEMPNNKKGEFAYYLLTLLLTSNRTSNIYRSLEKISKKSLVLISKYMK